MQVKGCKVCAVDPRLWPLSKEGSLSCACHACCDIIPRFLRSRLKDRPSLVAFYNKQGVLKPYSKPAGSNWTLIGTFAVMFSGYQLLATRLIYKKHQNFKAFKMSDYITLKYCWPNAQFDEEWYVLRRYMYDFLFKGPDAWPT